MLIDIEREYAAHVRKNWRKFSGFTRNIFVFRRNRDYMYKIISQLSLTYLHKKLNSLEDRKPR